MMRVILLEEIPGLGGLGAVVRVKNGFARNFLFPRLKAERATKAAVAEFERRRAELEERQRAQVAALESARAELDGRKIQITAKAGPDGGLYGSVTPAMVAAALNRVKPEGIPDIAKGQVHMPDGHLKHTGESTVEVALRPGLRSKITVAVVAEGEETTVVPSELIPGFASPETAPADPGQAKLKEAVLAAASAAEPDDSIPGESVLRAAEAAAKAKDEAESKAESEAKAGAGPESAGGGAGDESDDAAAADADADAKAKRDNQESGPKSGPDKKQQEQE